MTPPLPKAHIGANLRQPREQVQQAGGGANDEADDLLLCEGLGGEGGREHSLSGGSFRGAVSPQCNIYVIMQGKASQPTDTTTADLSSPSYLIAWLHRQESPPPEAFPGDSHRIGAAQQWCDTHRPQDEQEHRIDRGRHWIEAGEKPRLGIWVYSRQPGMGVPSLASQ